MISLNTKERERDKIKENYTYFLYTLKATWDLLVFLILIALLTCLPGSSAGSSREKQVNSRNKKRIYLVRGCTDTENHRIAKYHKFTVNIQEKDLKPLKKKENGLEYLGQMEDHIAHIKSVSSQAGLLKTTRFLIKSTF